jgi:aryl-alcohol dehydrogenase-like predicted oxidoreductase
MTFGKQNSEQEGHQQLNYSIDQGINFIDTAELYPVPAEAETYGETEKIIGNWITKNNNRSSIIIASKVAGPGAYTKHIRETGFSKEGLNEAVNNSLVRLKTDYIDLYQLHWPERFTNTFGLRGYNHHKDEKWKDNINEVLNSLNDIINSGKIRHIGLSNENPWGVMRFLEESKNDLPRMITIQNPYSLLNRQFEIGNAEISHREKIGLLAYSPLAFGVLTGKYIQGKDLPNSRLNLFKKFVRYNSKQSSIAAKKYMELAQDNGLTLTKMALAFVNHQQFLTSNIIGATNIDQLKENIDSINVKLDDKLIKNIEEIHSEMPDPAS